MSRDVFAARGDARVLSGAGRPLTRREVLSATGVLFLGALAGCDSRPKAPALRDSSVYQSRAAQLRFLVPQGWTQVASSDLPPGPLATEVMLAKYQMKTSARGAMLEILCMNNSDAIDLGQYHAQPSHGVDGWREASAAVELAVGGATGQRFFLQGVVGKNTMHKEVSAFRRGARVVSFVGLYWDDDHDAREEMRRAVASIVW